MSISPTLIIPVLANNGRYFKVKTLLDSGSGTNWIVRRVLNQVKHKVKGTNTLQVFTFNGIVKQKFTLVEIYLHDANGKTINILCYVQEQYTTHVTVEGITAHVNFNHTTPYSLSKPLADPNSTDVDHTDAPNSIGMIFCSATINSLRTNEPVILLPELKMLLEPTIFGTAISGSVPKYLKSQTQRISAHNAATRLVCETRDVPAVRNYKQLEFMNADKEHGGALRQAKQELDDHGCRGVVDLNSKPLTHRFKVVMFGSAALLFQLAAVLHVIILNDCAKHLFNVNINWDGKYTKQSALSFCNKICDPLGLLMPLVIRVSLFIQELWEQSFHHREDLKRR